MAATTDHTFICWKCGYDLTKNVQEEEKLSTRVFRTVRNKNRSGFSIALQKAQKLLLPDSKEWRIQVLCPQEGTANIFSSEAVSAPNAPQKIRGEPPNLTDDVLIAAAKEVTPTNSLTHANDSAKFVVQNISIISVILGGLSLFGNFTGTFGRHPIAFGGTIVLAAAALLLAVFALLPRLFGLNINNLLAVGKFYEHLILRRGRFAIAATVTLLVAISWATVSFFIAFHHQPTAIITTTLDSAAQQPTLDIVADISDLPENSVPTLVVYGLNSKSEEVARWKGIVSANTQTARIQGRLVNFSEYDSLRFDVSAKPDADAFQRSTYYVTRAPSAEISATWTGADAKAGLDIFVNMKNLLQGSAPEVTVLGSRQGKSETTVWSWEGAGPLGSIASVRTTLDKVRGYAKLRIVVGVKDGGKLKTLAIASAIPSTRTIFIQPIR